MSDATAAGTDGTEARCAEDFAAGGSMQPACLARVE